MKNAAEAAAKASKVNFSEWVRTAMTEKLDRDEFMQKWQCGMCGWVYDPEEGDPEADIKPGTSFDDLPPDWVCPMCGASKGDFEPYN